MRAAVSAIGKGIVGILAKVSAECENADVNVIEVSQTLLQDMFAMIMLIDITKGNTTLVDFVAHMENVGKQSGLTIRVMHEDIFSSIRKIQGGGCMANVRDTPETIKMIDEGYPDARVITMGVPPLDYCSSDINKSCEKIYNKVTRLAKNLIKMGEDIEREYGTPIISKRVSVTPIAILAAISDGDPVKYTRTFERCAQAVGASFIGSYSASVQKGCAAGDRELMEPVPRALTETEHVCVSINIGSTKAGINANAVELMGRMVKETVKPTEDRNYIGTAKLVIFCNAPEDNSSTADTSHGVGEADCVINVGVSGPDVARAASTKADKSLSINEFADTTKKTAFKITCMGQLAGTLASERLDIPFGVVNLSLAPTPAIRNSVACTLEEMGLESCGACGTTACLAMLNDAVEKGGIVASSTVGGLSGAFAPASRNAGMTVAVRVDTLCLEKLEVMTVVCSVGLDMIVIPDETTPEIISGITAGEAVIGMVSSKTTAVRIILTIGKEVGEELEFGGSLRSDPVTNINQTGCSVMIHRKGRIPAPIQALKN